MRTTRWRRPASPPSADACGQRPRPTATQHLATKGGRGLAKQLDWGRVELSGKVALVTGSSRGIGREIARAREEGRAGGGPLPQRPGGGPGDARLP
jgi:hypothetical protein